MSDGGGGSATVLLAMDFMSGIVSGIDRDQAVTRAMASACRGARDHGVPVVHVVVSFRPGYPDISTRNRGFRAVAEAGRMVTGSPESAIHPALGARADEPVVVKKRISAFAGSDLDVLLRSLGAETLVLGGIATSGVVLSTVRAAADMDYRLVVLEDCCTDRDPEVHRMLLDRVLKRQADITTAAEWVKSLGGGAGGTG